MNTAKSLLLVLTVGMFSSARADITVLHPRPKTAWATPLGFLLSKQTPIIVNDQRSPVTTQALAYLQLLLKQRYGDTLRVVRQSQISGPQNAIIFGEAGAFARMRTAMSQTMVPGETLAVAESYLLDINSTVIVIAGATPAGTFDAVSTFAQLLPSSIPNVVNGAHVLDYPDYPNRWIFSQHNFLGANVIATMRGLEDTMAYHKMNGINQGDYKYNILDLMRAQIPNYFDSIAIFKSMSALRNIDVIPAVAGIGWADGILWHDPNLAEGLPARVAYVIEGDTGRLLPKTTAGLPGGAFESVNNGVFNGWSWYDGAKQSVFVDSAVVHGGKYSARCTSFAAGNAGGNCRFQRSMACDPYHSYVLSGYVKTQNFAAGMTQLFVAGTSGGNFYSLTYTQLGIPATTSGWMRVEVTFNTLQFDTIAVYAGVWGGTAGTIWWDDLQLTDGGLTNVLRRTGTPVHVYNARGTQEYREGADVDSIIDPKLATSHGTYGPWHTPPTLRRVTTGRIHNGDTVAVTYYHPFAAVSDENGNGSVMVCVSEDTLYRILRDQITRVDSLYHPATFFLSHDEIRNMNHDSACVRRGVSPAVELSDNLLHCKAIVDSVHPGARSLVWNDMFDSLHNAHNMYYLVNGDLTGDWNLIDTAITIVNWNGGNARNSLSWFSRQGFRQITSPYYDVGNTSTIRAWRLAQEGVPNVDGMMYTTWANDYRFLTAFGDYAWSAGPYLMHAPRDTTVLQLLAGGSPVPFSATVLPDNYDAADAISSVHVLIDGSEHGTHYTYDLALNAQGGNVFSGQTVIPTQHGFKYHLEATNVQGIRRVTPTYVVGVWGYGTAAVAESPEDPRIMPSVTPDPATSRTVVSFMIPQSGPWELHVVDILGREVLAQRGAAIMAARQQCTVEVSQLPAGAYRCVIRTATGSATHSLIVSH